MIIGKLIPAATGLKRYRIDRDRALREGARCPPYARAETEAELLAALEEIGSVEEAEGLGGLGLDFPAEQEPADE